MIQKYNNKIALVILCTSVFIDSISYGMVIPLIPFYAQSFHASPTIIGILLSTPLLIQLFVSSGWGIISDRFGCRSALLLNILGSSIAFLCLALANSLMMLFISRILEGIASASITIAEFYVVNISNRQNRTSYLGFMEAASGVGFLLGPAITSLLVGNDPLNPNFSLPGLVAGGFSLLTLGFAYLQLPEMKKSKITQTNLINWHPQQLVQSLLEVFKRPLVGVLMSIIFVVMFGGIGVQTTLALWCQERLGWGPQQFGYIFIFCGVLGASIQIGLIQRLVQRFGETNLLLWGLIYVSVGLLLIPFSNTWILFIGALGIAMIGQAIASPIFTSLLSQLAGARQQGKTLGLAKSVTSLASFLGIIFAGFIFEKLGSSWPYWIGGLLISIAAALSWKTITHSQVSLVMKIRRQHKLKCLFNVFDYDKNGTIEINDFEQAVANLARLRSWHRESEEYKLLYAFWVGFGEELQNLLDLNNNGKIELTEWLSCFEHKIDYDFSMALIQFIDANKDEQIAIEELKIFYENYRIEMINIEDIFQSFDFDRNNFISAEEFRQIFDQFVYSEDLEEPGNLLLGIDLIKNL